MSFYVMIGHTATFAPVCSLINSIARPLKPCCIGDTANVIGEWTTPSASSSSHAPMPSITVCSKHNLFIHHPDILLTATSLSNASQCLRKPLLSNMVRSSSDVTPSLIWGNMLHEVMQTCLSVARWDDKFMDKKIAEVAQAGLGELLRIDMGVEQAIIEVKTRAKGLKVFAEKYIAQSPKVGSVLRMNEWHANDALSPRRTWSTPELGVENRRCLLSRSCTISKRTSGRPHMASKGRLTPLLKPWYTTWTTRALLSLVPHLSSRSTRHRCRSRSRLVAQWRAWSIARRPCFTRSSWVSGMGQTSRAACSIIRKARRSCASLLPGMRYGR